MARTSHWRSARSCSPWASTGVGLTVVSAPWLRPLPGSTCGPGRLLRREQARGGEQQPRSTRRGPSAVRRAIAGHVDVSKVGFTRGLAIQGRLIREVAGRSGFFHLFGAPIRGRDSWHATAARTRRVAVSHRVWMDDFGGAPTLWARPFSPIR